MGKIRFLGPTRTVDAAPHVSRKQVKSPEGKNY